MKHVVLEGSMARPPRLALGISERVPLTEKKSLRMSGDKEGQGHGVRRGTAAPVMVMPVVQGPSLGPFTTGHSFLWNPLTAPWSGNGVRGMLAQAAGHRVSVSQAAATVTP